MNYFAYGSNMSLSRLWQRTPGARRIGQFCLVGHTLRFHKVGRDGSGKCDAYFTGSADDVVFGALFELPASEKSRLDEAEGLGRGYDESEVTIVGASGVEMRATTYRATHIEPSLAPYSWYKHHVLVGARESALPLAYIRAIEAIDSLDDPDRARDARERAIHATASRPFIRDPGKTCMQ